MAIQFDVFINSKEQSRELMFFENDSKESFDSCIIPEFKELIELSITSKNNVLLQVEGLDLPAREDGWSRLNDGNLYLYSIKNRMKDALIPGYYQVLLCENQVIYYSWFKILPKHMGIAEWELMRNEIEEEVVGLSLDFKYRNTGFKHKKYTVLENQILFNTIAILESELSSFMRVTNQIILNPKNNISKMYTWVSKEKKIEIDQETIKVMSKSTDKKGYIYTGKRYINYDIYINRELIFNLKRINKMLLTMKNTLNTYLIESIKNGMQKETKIIKEALNILKTYLQMISKILNMPWVKSLNNSVENRPSINMNKDYRYNYISQLYQKLLQNKPKNYLNSNYQLYWKRSDLLYEIWGYLKIIMILKDFGFTPKSGWIFDFKVIEIPFLAENTTVVFEKENIRINVVYNKKIPKNNDNSDIYNPLYTKKSNNKPDIRVDVFKNDSYYKSIIMDTKYRSFYSLWERDEGVKTQLRNYKDSMKSKLLFKGSSMEKQAQKLGSQPISEVWVLFPNSGNKDKEKKIESDENIFFKELSPTKDMDVFKNDLITLIDDLINIDTDI